MTSTPDVEQLAAAVARHLAEAQAPRPAFVDAAAAAALFDIPKSWLLAEARADRVPHVRLGRYVRFDPAKLREWASQGQRGPRAGRR